MVISWFFFLKSIWFDRRKAELHAAYEVDLCEYISPMNWKRTRYTFLPLWWTVQMFNLCSFDWKYAHKNTNITIKFTSSNRKLFDRLNRLNKRILEMEDSIHKLKLDFITEYVLYGRRVSNFVPKAHF